MRQKKSLKGHGVRKLFVPVLQVYSLQDLTEQIPLPKKFEINKNYILKDQVKFHFNGEYSANKNFMGNI